MVSSRRGDGLIFPKASRHSQHGPSLLAMRLSSLKAVFGVHVAAVLGAGRLGDRRDSRGGCCAGVTGGSWSARGVAGAVSESQRAMHVVYLWRLALGRPEGPGRGGRALGSTLQPPKQCARCTLQGIGSFEFMSKSSQRKCLAHVFVMRVTEVRAGDMRVSLACGHAEIAPCVCGAAFWSHIPLSSSPTRRLAHIRPTESFQLLASRFSESS